MNIPSNISNACRKAFHPWAPLPDDRGRALRDAWYHADDSLHSALVGAKRREGAKSHSDPRIIEEACGVLRGCHFASKVLIAAAQHADGEDKAYLDKLSRGVYGAWHTALRWHWKQDLLHPMRLAMAWGTAVYVGTEALAQGLQYHAITQWSRLVAGFVMAYPTIKTLRPFLVWLAKLVPITATPVDQTSTLSTVSTVPHARTAEWTRAFLRFGLYGSAWSLTYMFGMEAMRMLVHDAGNFFQHFDALRAAEGAKKTLLVSGAFFAVGIEWFLQNRMREQYKLPATMARSLAWGIASNVWIHS